MTDAKAEAPILWPPDAKNWLIWKDPDASQDWRREEKGTTEDEMDWWHHQSDGHEFEQAPEVADVSPGVLQSMGSQRGGHDWTTELKDIDNSVWCTFLRCFADIIIATKGKNLTAWWSDCSHDISCYIFLFSKYSCFTAFTVFWQSLLYCKVTQLHTYMYSFLYIFPLWFITGYWI